MGHLDPPSDVAAELSGRHRHDLRAVGVSAGLHRGVLRPGWLGCALVGVERGRRLA